MTGSGNSSTRWIMNGKIIVEEREEKDL